MVRVLGGDARFLAALPHHIYPVRHLQHRPAAPATPRAVRSVRRAAVQAAAPGTAAPGSLPQLLHGRGLHLSARRWPSVRLLSCGRQGLVLCILISCMHACMCINIITSKERKHAVDDVRCLYLPDTKDPNGTAVAVGERDRRAASRILSSGGLPQLLDAPSAAHPVVLREDPPRPPRVHGSYRLRHVVQPLGRERRPFYPGLGRPSARAMPCHHAVAMVLHPPN